MSVSSLCPTQENRTPVIGGALLRLYPLDSGSREAVLDVNLGLHEWDCVGSEVAVYKFQGWFLRCPVDELPDATGSPLLRHISVAFVPGSVPILLRRPSGDAASLFIEHGLTTSLFVRAFCSRAGSHWLLVVLQSPARVTLKQACNRKAPLHCRRMTH